VIRVVHRLLFFPQQKNLFPQREGVLDVTLRTSSLEVPILNWRVSDEDSFSDHRYIFFELGFFSEEKVPFRNPRNTDWSKFKTIVSKHIKSLGPISDVESTANRIEEAFGTAFKASCKISRPAKHNFPPYFDEHLIKLRKAVR
uniref:hypothetical protein n=1 Tax=Streptomyces sp. IBSBF 2390 TaxID=2903533 RepID=UPI002FDBA1BE